MTKLELLKKAEDLHYDLMELENESPSDEVTDEQFDMMLELSNLMREFIHEKHHKSYFEVPGIRDFYSGKIGEAELDPDIAEAIRIFNKKGYKTIASCSGHARPGDWWGYVYMENYPSEPLPKGFFTGVFKGNDLGDSIRWRPATEKSLKKCHKLLLEYALSVKDLNKKKATNLDTPTTIG